jgi:DNA-binding XRE family transcriptional regulator
MKLSKQKKLVKAGFKVGTVKEFLGLSDEEMALIDLKISLVELLQKTRKAHGVTQHDLAKLIASSQSRIAKMEAADADVSLDLICKALFALGVSQRQMGRTIASRHAA